MASLARYLLILAAIVTIGAAATWLATGRHYYTKFTVVEQVETPIDADDPFAEAGFFDEQTQTITERRDEFHLGLLPTPQGLFDKHALSVVSIVLPVWLVAAVLTWWARRRDRSIRQRAPGTANP